MASTKQSAAARENILKAQAKWQSMSKRAHLEGDHLVPDTRDAQEVIQVLASEPVHVKADIFKAKDRPNIPERTKPTTAQQQARSENMQKAQQVRWTK